jgi:hypothetical protein
MRVVHLHRQMTRDWQVKQVLSFSSEGKLKGLEQDVHVLCRGVPSCFGEGTNGSSHRLVGHGNESVYLKRTRLREWQIMIRTQVR